MNESSAESASTRVSRIINAERKAVYHAFLDPDSVVSWLAPNNMRGHVHTFDAREDGTFRMSLTYQNPEHSLAGKTSEDTDTFQGRFDKHRGMIEDAVLGCLSGAFASL